MQPMDFASSSLRPSSSSLSPLYGRLWLLRVREQVTQLAILMFRGQRDAAAARRRLEFQKRKRKGLKGKWNLHQQQFANTGGFNDEDDLSVEGWIILQHRIPLLYMSSMSRIWGEFVRSICLLVHNSRWFSRITESLRGREQRKGLYVWNHIFRRSMGNISCLKVWLKSTLHFGVKSAPGARVYVCLFRLGRFSSTAHRVSRLASEKEGERERERE